MLECTVCGLLFTATDTCPSCGSTIAEEIKPEGMLGSDFDIPGLDDLAQTVGDDELEDSMSKQKHSTPIYHLDSVQNHRSPNPHCHLELVVHTSLLQ